jgi:hypothetical protein
MGVTAVHTYTFKLAEVYKIFSHFMLYVRLQISAFQHVTASVGQVLSAVFDVE